MRIILTILMLAALAVVVALPAFAATPQVLGDTGDFTFEKLIEVATNLSKFILRIAGWAVVGVIAYYGVRMVMAGADSAAFAAARKGLNWAILGALVIFGVYTIIATIQGAVNSVGR